MDIAAKYRSSVPVSVMDSNVSQYDARAIASKNRDQSLEESRLLIGVNDLHAAEQMHLKAEPWKDTSVLAAHMGNSLSMLHGIS